MKQLFTLLLGLIFAFTMQAQNNNGKANSIRTEKDGFKWQPYMELGRTGAKSLNGEVLVPAKYETCYYEMGHFSVKDNVGRYGVYNRKGKCIVPAKYIKVFAIKGYKGDSPYVVIDHKGYGVYSSDGKNVIPAQYINIEPYITNKGLFFSITDYNSYTGIAKENGTWIIKPSKYNAIIVESVKDDVFFSYLTYGINRCSGVLDINGKELISTKYSVTRPSLATNGTINYQVYFGFMSAGLLNSNGEIIQNPKTTKTYTPNKFGSKTIYVVTDENGLWGIADENKTMKIPCKYDFIRLAYPYFTVREGNYMGMYNDNYKIIVPTSDKYVSVSYLNKSQGNESCITAISKKYKQALFDLEAKKISDANHQHVLFKIFNTSTGRKDTIIVFSDEGKYGCEDITHKTIFPARYQDLNYLETPIGNFFYVFQSNLVGLCDSKGNEIIEPQYTSILFKRAKNKDYFAATNGEFVALFDVDGTQLINGETFSKIFYDEKKSQFIATQDKRTCIFSIDGTLLSDNALDIEQDKYISLADDYFERGKYKSAAKNYGLAINIRPTASLYFNRAVSYYNMNKYYDAISDFKSCLNNNPSKHLTTRSLELIDKAEEYQIQKEERQNQVVSAIFGLVLTGANAYYQIQAQKQRTKYTSQGLHTSSDYNYSIESSDSYSSTSSTHTQDCPSLKVSRGRWYCANTGRCGMCGGDGLMDGGIAGGANSLKCTLCGGSGKCKYCQ